ncbi:MAG: 50S ribosomal protein L4 [Parcubacteria group bacterium GW2011_GWC2_45_7]|nr:MAG: 50S ribosomal protein L4 [Parcubacteria group bacterium GW2011_GWC2_45_7]KKU73537.1 MAG: 50S ribosomal protein L4 [Parcubacteria group bacterium GW2011_GWA2_47_26]
MLAIPVYGQDGKQVSTLDLNPAVFGVKPKVSVLHEAVVAQRAKNRPTISSTKTRGEVRGGGRKPWKQKGTGRARHGSIRSPIWRGGGIIFGPRPERNWSKKINRRVLKTAILMALSDKALASNLVVLDNLIPSADKTKMVANIIGALPLKRGKTLLALSKTQKPIGRLAVNITRLTPIWVGSLNVVDLLGNINLVTTVDGLKELEQIYRPK